MTPILQKVTVVLVTLIILAGVAYYSLTNIADYAPSPDLSETGVVGQDILVLVEKLKNASIDQSFFSSVLFVSLRDFNTSLLPESQGRPNPFAPIGVDNG
ncbi:MAG: hypothetical protein WAX85_01215 [Minisyncoccia bacterium]